LPEVQTLRQVLEQQFPGGPHAPPRGRRPMGQEVIESPHEPQARRGQKRGQSWTGYKVQLSETCDPDQPHLVVDLEPTGALANDAPQLAPIRERLQARGIVPAEQYIDQGYMSAAELVRSAQAGICLMGRPLEDTQGPPGFRQGEFAIDETAQTARCPAGQTSQVWSERQVTGAPQPQVQLRFDGKVCQGCGFFGQCTASPQGRSLTLHPFRAALAARRGEANEDVFQTKMRLRAGIEATISELVRGYGLRQARYRGLAKLGLQSYFTAVAVNLSRLARWWARPAPAV